MQVAYDWQPNPLFGHGGVYEAEWDEVIRKGWQLPKDWDPDEIREPEVPLTKWGDYSQYQKAHVDDSYPYRVMCFRASVADNTFRDRGSVHRIRRHRQQVPGEHAPRQGYGPPGQDSTR